MKAKVIMTLEHALFWQRSGKRREVRFVQGGYFEGDNPEGYIYITDHNSNISATLPMPFKGDIDKLLCQTEQTQVQAQVDEYTTKLDNLKVKCDEMDKQGDEDE